MRQRRESQAQIDVIAREEADTARLAGIVARAAVPGDVIALSGDLGSGKTAFARGFIRALTAPAEEVPSPTFTLVQTYSANGRTIYHFDFYRIDDPEEAWEIGIEEAFAGGITLIEWPERLGSPAAGRPSRHTLGNPLRCGGDGAPGHVFQRPLLEQAAASAPQRAHDGCRCLSVR